MKKSNVILQAAIASALLAMVGSANAGTISAANTVFASQNFRSTNGTAVTITPGAVTYSTSSSLTVNPSTHLYFVMRLTSGTFNATPAVATFTLAGTTAGAAAAGAAPGLVVTRSADNSTLLLDFTTQTGATTLLGLGAMTWTPAANAIATDNAAMSVPGATVSATTVLTLSTVSAANLQSTVALPTSVDLPSATGAIATSTSAIAGSVSALSTYTNKIDLTATPVATDYSLRVVGTNDGMALGAVTFTTTTGRKQIDGTTDYTLEADSTNATSTATITATPGTGQAWPIGATLWTDITSTGCIIANKLAETAAVTLTTSTTAKTFAVTAGNLTSGTAINVCMSRDTTATTAAARSAITPITATLTGATVPVAADAPVTVTGTGYPVTYNGSQTDVRNYVPAAATGYNTFVRVINTGSVSAAISAARIDPTTGTAGTSCTLGTLAAGAARNFTPTEIEATACLGAFASTDRPRLRITAPTNGMEVQTFLALPSGDITDMTGAQ